MSGLRRHLTANNVLAAVALFLALGSGAVAIGLKRNSVRSKQIKDGAVQTQDIKDDALTDPKFAKGQLTAGDVGNDVLTGNEIDESTLQGIQAANATTIGGMSFKSIDFQSSADNVTRNMLDFPGQFGIAATCQTGGDGLNITGVSSVDNAKITLTSYFATGGASGTETASAKFISSQSVDLDAGDPYLIDDVLPASGLRQHVSLLFRTPAGFVASVDFATDEPGVGQPCKVTGSAIGG